MAIYGGPDIVTDGLVLHLDAANSKSYPGSGTSWFDLSGNNNHGTLTNGPTYTSANKGSIVFDGINDYITLGTKNIITTDFSVNMSIRVTAATKEVHFFSFGYWDNPSAIMYRNEASPYDLSIIYRNLTGTNTLYASSFVINQNTTYNITWTRSNSNNILYINGINIYSFSNSIIFSSVIYDIGWATVRNKTTAYYQGNIYNTTLYNRALSAIEVLQNYNALKGRYGL